LRDNCCCRIGELRQEAQKEENCFRIGDTRENTLSKNHMIPSIPFFYSSYSELFLMKGLKSKKYQICGSGIFYDPKGQG